MKVQSDRETRQGMPVPLEHNRSAPLQHNRSAPLGHNRSVPLEHNRSAPLQHNRSAPLGHNRSVPLEHDRSALLGHNRSVPLEHDRSALLGHNRSVPLEHNRSAPLGHNRVAPNAYAPRQDAGSRNEAKQLRALKSEYDNMEESLRDALRHNSRQNGPKLHTNQPRSSYGGDVSTSHHPHLAVYKRERPTNNCRNFSNSYENVAHPSLSYSQPTDVPHASPPSATSQLQISNVEEIRKYCAFLTERIQEVENQNIHLLKFSESQKAEYDKVTAQVIESERSQRHLLNECSNLRRQVLQLAGNNKRLKEQRFFNSNPSSPTSPRAPNGSGSSSSGIPFEHDHTSQRHTSSSMEPFVEALGNLHSTPGQGGSNNSVFEAHKASDLAAIIEWYSTLQKSTTNDFLFNPDISDSLNGSNFSPTVAQPPIPPLDQYYQQLHDQRENFVASDYASPSSICATASCSCCTKRSNNVSKNSVAEAKCSPLEEYNAENGLHPLKQKRACRRIRSLESKQTPLDPADQSFDNQAYEEVEIKQNIPLAVSDQAIDSSQFPHQRVNFNQNNRFEISHDGWLRHEPTLSSIQRSSNFSSENDVSQKSKCSNTKENQFQRTAYDCSDSSDVFQHTEVNVNQNNSNCQAASKTDQQADNKSKNVGNVRYSRKSSSSSVSESRGPPKLNSFPKHDNKAALRSSSTSDLPPPPPTPPEVKKQLGFNSASPLPLNLAQSGLNRRSRCSSADASTTNPNPVRSISDTKEESQPKRTKGFSKKLSLWKNRNEAQQHHLADKHKINKPQNKPCGYRRGSYAAACRKSQSLDHLYEQALRENEKMRKLAAEQEKLLKDAMKVMASNDFQTNPTTSPTSPAEMSTDKRTETAPTKNKNDDDVFALPEKSECSQKPQPSNPYEVMSPLKGGVSGLKLQHPLPQKRYENRHHSEISGSAGDNLTECSQMRRHRSVGNDVTVDKEKEPLSKQSLATGIFNSNTTESHQISEKGVSSQLRFPKTNLPSRHQQPAEQSGPKKESVLSSPQRSESRVMISNQPLAAVIKSSERKLAQRGFSSRPTNISKPIKPQPENLLRSVTEENMLNTEIVHDCNDGKNSEQSSRENKEKTTNNNKKESKSFVDIMKAKFYRSSGSRASSAAKKKSNEKVRDPIPKPDKPFIDPRTLSLEPNHEPLHDKGRSVKKFVGQKLGQNSDAAVGRKLSQPFPNGVGEGIRSITNLNVVAEEVLSDEGFAEGSTIDRIEKESFPVSEVSEQVKPLQRCVDASSSNFARKQRHDSNELYPDASKPGNNGYANSKNADRYQNVAKLKKEVKLLREKQTKITPSNDPHYENFPLNRKVTSIDGTNYENIETDFHETQTTASNQYSINPISPTYRKMKTFVETKAAPEQSMCDTQTFIGSSKIQDDATQKESQISTQGNRRCMSNFVDETMIPENSCKSSLENVQRLPFPSSIISEEVATSRSTETGSSFGSLPSDGILCNNSASLINAHEVASFDSPELRHKETTSLHRDMITEFEKRDLNSKASIFNSEQGTKTKRPLPKPQVPLSKPTGFASKLTRPSLPVLLKKDRKVENFNSSPSVSASLPEYNSLATSKNIVTALSVPKVFRSTSSKLPSPAETTECRENTKKNSGLSSSYLFQKQLPSTKSIVCGSGLSQASDETSLANNPTYQSWLYKPQYENAIAIEKQKTTQNKKPLSTT